MDFQGLLFYFFAIISTLYVIHLGLYLIGANLYDVWQYGRQFKDRADNPLVTIAIPAHNEEKVIVRCLDSIRHSNYPNIEIIVVDDASIDQTRQIVRSYIKRYPSLRLRISSKRKNVGKGEALSFILRRYAKGEFAMMVDADSVIRNDAITKALTYFDDPQVDGVAANVQIIHDPNVLGILQQLEHMIGYRSKKTYSLLNSEFVVGGVAPTKTYSVSSWLNLKKLTNTTSGEVGFYIDEYNSSGQWISGQYKTGDHTLGATNVGFAYKPTSTNVSKARLQIIDVGAAGIQAYVDDVVWSAN